MPNTYIFLGFDYESWYYQLLCHRLNIKTDKQYSILSTPDCRNNDYTNRIMGKHFRMDFTGESPVKTIDRIIETCENSGIENADVLRETNIGGRYSLVFSYAWKKEGVDSKLHLENIVDCLENEIRTNEACSFNIFRDKNDLSLGDSLPEFMNALSTAETIVQVISKKYLKSKNCMYEALKIHENQRNNMVYRIVVKENENEQFDEEKITSYWKKKYDEGIKHINNTISDSIEQGKAKTKWDLVLDIHEFIPTFFKDLFENLHLVVLKDDFKIKNDGSVVLKKKKKEMILEKICRGRK